MHGKGGNDMLPMLDFVEVDYRIAYIDFDFFTERMAETYTYCSSMTKIPTILEILMDIQDDVLIYYLWEREHKVMAQFPNYYTFVDVYNGLRRGDEEYIHVVYGVITRHLPSYCELFTRDILLFLEQHKLPFLDVDELGCYHLRNSPANSCW